MDYLEILRTNYPYKQWAITDNDYSTLVWLEEETKPTKAKLESQWQEVQYKVALNKVNDQRRQAYTLEADPLNFKYQETLLEADRQAWLDKKAEIQARYPEPEVPVK